MTTTDEQLSWLPDSPSFADIGLCYCLIGSELTVSQNATLGYLWGQQKLSATPCLGLSTTGQRKLDGLIVKPVSELLILRKLAQDSAISAKSALKAQAFIAVARSVALLIDQRKFTNIISGVHTSKTALSHHKDGSKNVQQ